MSIDRRSNHLDASETTPLLVQPDDYDVETASSHKVDEEPFPVLSSASSLSGGLEVTPALERHASNSLEDVPKAEDYAARFNDVTPTQFWVIFSGILAGYMIGFFDSTLMASSHPVITSYFNAANSASWLSTAFLLTSTAFMPLFGRVSDAFGRKPVYLFSIAMFFFTTAACGLARNIGDFIAARALCGLGAGGVFSIGQIISSDLVRLEYRGIYQSYINLCLGAGGSIGLAFGGYLCDHIGWRGAFFIQLPLIFVYFFAAAWTVPANLGRKTVGTEHMKISQLIRSIDITGSFILITSVTLLILGLNLGGNVLPWSHPLIFTSLSVSFVLAVIFVRYEPRVERPVMPIELLTTDPRASIIFGSFFAAVSINTVVFNAPLYFQAVKLTSPTTSGLRLVASSIAITFSSVSTGFLINSTRRLQPFVLIGVCSMILGGFAAASMGMDTSHPVAMICISFSSFGQGFAFPSLMVSMLATSKQEDQAVATTTLGLWRSLGSVMGVAVSSWIFQNALIYHLNQKVTGVEKDHIIALVRKSVHSISQLDPVHRLEVTRSYSDALRMTFFSAAIWAILVLFLMCRIRLPRLRRKA